MTQPRPKLLADWIENPMSEVIKIVENNEEELEPLEVGLGFEVPLGNIWLDPESKIRFQ